MQAALLTLAFAVAGLALWAAYTYNGLVRARNKVHEAFSGIDVHLRQRHDLVPALIETVKGYAHHERSLMESVTFARTVAMHEKRPDRLDFVEDHLAISVERLLALVHDYPEIEATGHFQQLFGELLDTENELQSARRLYNRNVEFFNTRAQSFPTLLIANRMDPNRFDFFQFRIVDTRRMRPSRRAVS